MENSISALKKRIVTERKKIWEQEPEDLAVLKKTNFPKSNAFASVIYAYGEIYQLTRSISIFKDFIDENGMDAEASAGAMKFFAFGLTSAAQRYKTWKLADASRLIEKVARALEDTDCSPEVMALLDELSVYNNKLFVWLDSSIEWFQLGKKISFK